MNCLAEFNKSL